MSRLSKTAISAGFLENGLSKNWINLWVYLINYAICQNVFELDSSFLRIHYADEPLKLLNI